MDPENYLAALSIPDLPVEMERAGTGFHIPNLPAVRDESILPEEPCYYWYRDEETGRYRSVWPLIDNTNSKNAQDLPSGSIHGFAGDAYAARDGLSDRHPLSLEDFPSFEANIQQDSVATANINSGSSSSHNCGSNCIGSFVGIHRCVRQRNTLTISCLGNDNCRSTFRTRNAFNRHYNSLHVQVRASTKRLMDCPFEGCHRVGRKGFDRKDNWLQHRRNVHGEDIPKLKVRFDGKASAKVMRYENSGGSSAQGGQQA